MILDIERDQRRFKEIVRGRIRENLRKYITHGEMIGRRGSWIFLGFGLATMVQAAWAREMAKSATR